MKRGLSLLFCIVLTGFTVGRAFVELIHEKETLSNFEYSIYFLLASALLTFLIVALIVVTTGVVMELVKTGQRSNKTEKSLQ